MTTSHVRFKINDKESKLVLTQLDKIKNRIVNTGGEINNSQVTREAMAVVLDPDRYISANFPVVSLVSDLKYRPGDTLLKMANIDINKDVNKLFNDVFKTDPDETDDFKVQMSSVFAGATSTYVKCVLNALLSKSRGNPFSNSGFFKLLDKLNKLLGKDPCLRRAVFSSLVRDMHTVVQEAYKTGKHGSAKYLADVIEDKNVSTAVNYQVLKTSIQNNDLGGFFDVASSSVANRMPTMDPKIMDTFRANFKMPNELKSIDLVTTSKAVFAGMDRIEPNWLVKPTHKQSEDFSKMIKAVGKDLDTISSPSNINLAFLKQTPSGQSRKDLFTYA